MSINVLKTLQKLCKNSAKTLQKLCKNSAKIGGLCGLS
jgi:hypothetical protein